MDTQAKTNNLFSCFNVRTVRNGFILTMNDNREYAMISDEIYVFNDLNQLSEFIKNLDNTEK